MRNAATALGGMTFLALTLPATRGLLPLARPLRPFTSDQRSSPSSHGQRSTGTGSAEDREFSCGRSMGACDGLVRTVPVRRRRRRHKSLTMLENGDGLTISAHSCGRESSTRCASRAYKVPQGVSLVASSHEVRMHGDASPSSVSRGAPTSVVGNTNLNGLRGTKRNVRWSIERSIPSNMALVAWGKRQRAASNFWASSPSQNIWKSICPPRLSLEEEVALGEDVQRWQSLERLREDGMGVEAWASAAGLSVSAGRGATSNGEAQQSPNDPHYLDLDLDIHRCNELDHHRRNGKHVTSNSSWRSVRTTGITYELLILNRNYFKVLLGSPRSTFKLRYLAWTEHRNERASCSGGPDPIILTLATCMIYLIYLPFR